MSGEPAEEPLAYLVVLDGGGNEERVSIFDQLFVGRECAGIGPKHRLVIRTPEVSRNHLEIRLDAATDRAFVIDTSQNGSLLNGLRLERAVPMPLIAGDEIRIGSLTLTFRSDRFTTVPAVDGTLTTVRIDEAAMVMVVGDITNYSTMSQLSEPSAIASSLNQLWRELGVVLRAHKGTLNHYAGDALYAVWNLSELPHADELAVDFALAANQRVCELGPQLAVQGHDGSPIHMGWGVVQGSAALAAMTRSVEAVIGDATNVAFRLAGLAGRDGRAPVMVTGAVHDAVQKTFLLGAAEQVTLKGRLGQETVFPVIARATRPDNPSLTE